MIFKSKKSKEIRELLKPIGRLEYSVGRLNGRIDYLVRRVTMLECDHKEIIFEKTYKKCSECGKVLKWYDNSTQLKQDQLAHLKEELQDK